MYLCRNNFLNLRWLKKIILYSLIAVIALIAGISVSVYFFKDKIIQHFIAEVNKSLNTPVKVGKIEIAAWEDFPDFAINIFDIYVEDGSPKDNALFTAKKVSFIINPIEAWKGNFEIRALRVEKSKLNAVIDTQGGNNFTIFKSQNAATPSIEFDLKNVNLIQTEIHYDNHQINQHHSLVSKKLVTSIAISSNVYSVISNGDIHINQLKINNINFFEGKDLTIASSLAIDNKKKIITIKSAEILIGKSAFALSGSYLFKDKDLIDINASGKNTSIQTLLSFIPESLSKKLANYQSKGDLYFKTTLKGEISKTKVPSITIDFGCKDASFFHPTFKSKIEHASAQASFKSPSMKDFSEAEASFKKLTGNLNGNYFEAELTVKNFNDPTVLGNFRGEVDAASLENFYPIKNVEKLSGLIKANISIDGKLSLLKSKNTAQQVKTSGTLELNNIRITESEQNITIKDLNGSLQFNNNDLALSNVNGKVEQSDFVLNGFLKNVITFLLFENQPIGIEADLQSTFLDMDYLFKIGLGEVGSKDFGFSISPLLHLNFNCDIKSLNYKKFKARKIKGNLLIRNQTAISRNTHLRALGGDITINGIADARNKKAIEISAVLNAKGIQLDSAFYVFDNFYQSFIEGKHLKGEASADVTLEATVNEKLELKPETLVADINATLKKGELNNFEPLQKLNKFLDDEGLSKLRFGDLKNDLHVENKTIYIPQMEIKSNLSTFQLSGTHTFDQHIDYHIVAPLRNKKKIDKDEAFGAIEEDGPGKTKLFIKITGTTDKYEVSLDKKELKKKIISDLKKEVKELKDAFKSKGQQKKKEIELQKDDYFDW
jgi:hypothetical protein